jgi:hypothetical protein
LDASFTEIFTIAIGGRGGWKHGDDCLKIAENRANGEYSRMGAEKSALFSGTGAVERR